jgi:polysaccharide deacetylase 2 family uncharacterized protein YibQ
VAADDLDTPLGSGARNDAPPRLHVSFWSIMTGLLALMVLTGTAWVLLVDDPLGGEPRAIVAIEDGARPAAPPSTVAASDARAKAKAQPGRTITIIDGRSGERREIVVGPADGEPETVASIEPRAGAPAADPALLELSRHGAIPRIGADGKRPLERYASATPNLDRLRGPRIAIVVAGLGIGAGATGNAIGKLPPAVTLAFAPYGSDTLRWAGRARGKGHELLLQLPMEPENYPDNDPGPQTLVSALSSEQNLDRLHWLLARLQGYVGVTNLMGARFLISEAALSPILRDVAARGLVYVDDGATPKSVAGALAAAIQAPFLKADVILDAKPGWSEIDAALSDLEAIAAQRGSAIGYAGVQPVTIERIVRWAKAAESRGIRLVPLSAVLARPKQQG